MCDELTLDELAGYGGENVVDLDRWQRDGLLPDRLTMRDSERVLLIRALEHHGLSYETISAAVRDHAPVIDALIDELDVPSRSDVTAATDALAQIGLDPAMLEQLGRFADFDEVMRAPTADDVTAFRNVRLAVEGGLPETVLFQLVRVYQDALARIADAEVRLFHLHVHQALRTDGLRGVELTAATKAASEGMGELLEPTLLYFHRKAWKDALREDLVIHVLEELGAEAPDGSQGRLWRAVVFVDLSAFTPLTDAMGDATAVTILDRFATLVRSTARAGSGNVVKQIGDGFMVVYRNANSAITATLALQRHVCELPQFPAMHAGIHYGPVLYRESDYIGGTVNVAARLLAEAGRNEIVVSEAARHDAGAMADARFEPLGRKVVRGFGEPIELYRVAEHDHPVPRGRTDPVCGMQLRDDEIAARVTVGGTEHVFCSTTCMQRFVTQPATAPGRQS